MDAREHVARLDQPPRGPLAQAVERRPPGTVDSGKAERRHGQAHAAAHLPPVAFGRHPPRAFDGLGVLRAGLGHPASSAVAIDSGRREVADPVGEGA